MRWVLAIAVVIAANCPHAVGDLIVNGDFEVDFTSGGPLPTIFGIWDFDPATTVGPTGGITPFQGQQMLQFLGSTSPATGGTPLTGTQCDVWQVVDVTSYAAIIDAGLANVSMSAWFNRVSNSLDDRFAINVRAFSGSVHTFPDNVDRGFLANKQVHTSTDADPLTWESAHLDLVLPQGTDCLGIKVLAAENVSNDVVNEFRGHFADAISLEITAIPEPSTLVTFTGLLSMGLICGWWRRKRKH
jgi:hypothetical protein